MWTLLGAVADFRIPANFVPIVCIRAQMMIVLVRIRAPKGFETVHKKLRRQVATDSAFFLFNENLPTDLLTAVRELTQNTSVTPSKRQEIRAKS